MEEEGDGGAGTSDAKRAAVNERTETKQRGEQGAWRAGGREPGKQVWAMSRRKAEMDGASSLPGEKQDQSRSHEKPGRVSVCVLELGVTTAKIEKL